MREIRIALLEADVSLPVVKDFIAQVKEQALGEKVVRSIQPGQMVVKIVHDELVKLLGSDESALNFNAVPPVVILMVGLQGSGKTTTSAKIANKIKNKKKVLLASLDVYRPAAQEQLAQMKPCHLVNRDMWKPKKEVLSIRIDSDVLASIKHGGPGWQTRINDYLRKGVASGQL